MFLTSSCGRRIALIVLLFPLWPGCCQTYWRSVPAQWFGGPRYYDAPRSVQEPINFLRLRQDPPAVYQLGPRDVLGIYIEGVLGEAGSSPPVHFSDQPGVPPAIGFPIPVREDGTLSLPLAPPIHVEGLTLAQAELEIQKAYMVDRKILLQGQSQIIVTLIEPRTYQVTVIREDTGNPGVPRATAQGELILGNPKRGMTYTVELPAYENDVVHALSATGGLPGVDAKNQVVIFRGDFAGAQEYQEFLSSAEDPQVRAEILASSANVIRIPLRTTPGEPLMQLAEDDIMLDNGDIVFIESREAEVFYTGGLLEGGQHPLPRDYDLDVLGAIAMGGGSVASAPGGSGSRFWAGSGGVGAIIPPTRAIVVRTIDGEQVPIRISLKRALVDPHERILIQPNDFILLEYTNSELIGNILLSSLQFNYFLNGMK